MRNIYHTRTLFAYLILQVLFFFACTTLNEGSKRNLSFLYNTEINRIKSDFVVFHKAQDYSTLYFRLKSSDILYERNNNVKNYEGIVKISYKLMNDYDTKEITDSASINLKFTIDNLQFENKSKQNEYLFDSINFKTPEAKTYVLQIRITDVNRRSVTEEFIDVDKTSQYSSQNFLIRTADNLPAFKNHFASNEKFRISINDNSIKSLKVKHYDKIFDAAFPAFLEHKENKIILKPDTSYQLSVAGGHLPVSSNLTSILNFKRTGIYFIQRPQSTDHSPLNTEEKRGLVIFRFYDDFPEITNTNAMLNPLIYITTKNEFDGMILAKNKKMEVDKFWLEISGNPDRARELIKKYYSRVREANLMFTSYMEGWMTDRGMIYVIFGKPNIVYKNANNETWIYGSTQSSRSIAFNFYRLANPFADNDFGLSRNTNYKNSWYLAVETWRR